MIASFGMSVCESLEDGCNWSVTSENLRTHPHLFLRESNSPKNAVVYCIQPQHANPLESWPHINTFKVTTPDRKQSVYSTCHPSFGKTCLFALSSVQRLNKHSLAYATYYCFSVFVSTNHLQIWPRLWAGCKKKFEVYCWWCGVGRVAQVTNSTPHLLSYKVTFGAAPQCRRPSRSTGAHH